MDSRTLVMPLLLIVIGTGWLLTTLGVVTGVDWVWTLGLAAAGLLGFLTIGFDKVTLVVGGFCLTASLLSLLRQTGRLTLDVEIPILVIVAGVLSLIARHSAVPLPKWLKTPANTK